MDENEITEQIEELAQLQFSNEEISTIMKIDIDDMNEKYADNVSRGRLMAEAEVRKSILQLAKQGSTPAQKQYLDLINAAKRF